jgi:predicted lipoprotein with Yx(FWY)xxD motif
MTRMHTLSLAAVLLVPAAVAGCGSGGSYGSGGSSPMAAVSPASATLASSKANLAVRKTSLGKVLVDSKGRTLYRFGADTKKNVSTCTGACAQNWPPAASPRKPKAGAGVSAKRLKVITRSDGTRQLSYAGHPLYRFAGDSKPGDVNGQNVDAFGGVWNVVAPSGKPVGGSGTGASSPSPAPTTPPYPTPSYPKAGSGGGGGGGYGGY